MFNFNKKMLFFLFFGQIISYGSSTNRITANINRSNICNHMIENKFDCFTCFTSHDLSYIEGLENQLLEIYKSHFPELDGFLELDYLYKDKIFSLAVVGKKFLIEFYNNNSLDNSTELLLPLKIYAQQSSKHIRSNLDFNFNKYSLIKFPNKFLSDEFISNFTSCFGSVLNIGKPVLLSSFDIYNVRVKNPIWTIMICTLKNRHSKFNELFGHILKQIEDLGMQDKIEILFCSDNRDISVGKKRNILLENSKGVYVAFADDDDWLSDDYVARIHKSLLTNPDCVSLVGEITFDGKDPHIFIHSCRYNSWYEENGIYYRFPNHLNPMKRSIAIQFKYPEINCSEDYQWAKKVFNSGLLKNESYLDKPYYFYRFSSKETETQR